MVFYNIKQSIRGMLNNKTFTFLNLTGFAIGFAVCIIIMIFAYREYTTDSSYPNAKNIYRVVDAKKESTAIDRDIVQELQKLSDVKLAVPVLYMDLSETDFRQFLIDMESGKSIETKESFIATNNDFFKMFSIKPLVSKANTPFADDKSMVLTRSIAMQLFGKIDVLDKKIKKEHAIFTVSAVVEDMPDNSSIKSGMFVNYKNPDYQIVQADEGDGLFSPSDIYLLLNNNTNIDKLTALVNADFPKNKGKTEEILLQAFQDIYMNPQFEESYNKTGNKSLIWVFITIAILTLIMSIFNYTNFTISRQMATLKNSGIRITNGALRGQIRGYYFTETSLAIILAFMGALFIAQAMMPYAEQLLGAKLGLHWLLEPKLLGIFISLFVLVVFLSAVSPIAFISRMKVQTLFGKTNIKSRKHPIKRIMTITQLVVSVVLLVAVFVVHKQLSFVKTQNLGFQTSHLLRLNIPMDYEKYDVMKDAFDKLPFVEQSSLTSHTPGSGYCIITMKNRSGEDVDMYVVNVDDNFLNTFGIELKEGRKFRKSELNKKCYYFTNYAKKLMGWENFEDIQLEYDRKVVGVVNDIFYNSLHNKMVPVAFQYSDNSYSGLNLKLSAGNLSQQMAGIEKIWKKTLGNAPFSFSFYDQYFDSLYKKEKRQSKALSIFVIIAFVITCMGLLGQVLQNTQNRIKEIGIRKIHGASIIEVMLLLNKEFIWTVITAFIIATPIAYYSMTKWLENFAYKTALSWWIFALAGLSALAIALFTVSWQSWRAARRNPVEALRYE